MVPAPVPRHRYTFRDYLAIEEGSPVKHEYFDGDIYAMAGGTPEHAALAVAVSASLLTQLRGRGCHVYSSDLRIRVLATGLSTYPDVSVVCGPAQTDPDNATIVTNPTLIVEVLSDGTEEYDRVDKFEHYKQIESLKEYVLVSQREPVIEVFRRGDDGRWQHSRADTRGAIDLGSVSATLKVDDIYRDATG
jgi:Uma2 family endonuclease